MEMNSVNNQEIVLPVMNQNTKLKDITPRDRVEQRIFQSQMIRLDQQKLELIYLHRRATNIVAEAELFINYRGTAYQNVVA